MTDSSIQMFWALSEPADEYALYRFPRDDVADPMTVGLTDDRLVLRSPKTGLIDEDVIAGTAYWYVLTAIDESGVEYRQATEAEAVTDRQPPQPVTGLTATRQGDPAAVVLTWDEGGDNHRFGRYAIRRSHNDEQSIYYGTGWTVDQTTFIDDRLPDGGTVTYEVLAVDFHANATEAATVTVDLG